MATDPKGREYTPLNVRIYLDEDPDLIEYIEGMPKTWLVKTALRFYRDNKDKPQAAPQPDDSEPTGKAFLGGL
ncbi:hypothetical protein [Paenibacillus sp. 1P03SA]|uniref:hypothetical protein n=1 Tax=Paenibacillus sp. 1P03SA TaxID=3132294 RepID=UPI0039A3F31B